MPGTIYLERNEAVPAVRKPFDHIVQDDEHDQDDKYGETDLHHDLFDLGAEISAENALERNHENLSSVQHRNRK